MCMFVMWIYTLIKSNTVFKTRKKVLYKSCTRGIGHANANGLCLHCIGHTIVMILSNITAEKVLINN